MARQRADLVGRQAELAAVDSVLSRNSPRPALVVVRGADGSGRSAVLAQLGRDLRADNVTVLDIPFSAERPDWDLFGAHAVLAAVREQFERINADPRLGESINLVSRLCTPDSYASPWQQSSLLGELSRMFARIGGHGRVAVLADDVDAVPMPVYALAPAHRAGHLVVATCTDHAVAPDETAELCALADQVVELGPLPDADVDDLLRQAANMPVDTALRRALRASLGLLYGNPGTLLSTVAQLRRCGRLVSVHNHLCLREPHEPIALPAEHPLLAEVGALGEPGRDVVILAASTATFTVDQVPVLAAATGRSPARCGEAVDRLVSAGVLESDPSGRQRCRYPALATTVLAQAGEDAVRELHRAMATRLLDEPEHARPGPAVLADHVAAAGSTLPPSPELATLLHDEALCAAELDPDRAATRYRAAWWHAQDSPGRPRLQAELVRLLVRAGRYERLAEFVAEITADGSALPADAAARAELATAAALASIHCGRPVAAEVRAALGETEALRCADQWFAGDPVRADEIETSFAALPAAWPKPATAAAIPLGTRRQPVLRSDTASVLCDLVPVFESVLGADYRVPETGPLATYHRVFQGFFHGDWPDALSAVRQLESAGYHDRVCRQVARLLAAEMCVWRGEDRRAAAWLDSVPRNCAFGALRGWVESGLYYRAGDTANALRVGWAAYSRRNRAAAEPGVLQLLLRLALIARESGQQRIGRRVLAEVDALHARDGGDRTRETALLVRGLVDSDGASARVGERLARLRARQPDLAWACLAVGQVAADPRPWLHEAYEIARSLGAPRLRAKARQLMEDLGVGVPAARTRRVEFSGIELRIIELIQQGYTNRQIALAVQMSEKTVENHLTRLFGKVGCRTRHGLAAASLGGQLESVGA